MGNVYSEISRCGCCELFFGQLLDLTKSEFQILSCLIRKPGWVFSRDQLLEQIWDDNHNSTDRAIDTHIKLMRQKMRVINDQVQSIKTHRGYGYALNDRW